MGHTRQALSLLQVDMLGYSVLSFPRVLDKIFNASLRIYNAPGLGSTGANVLTRDNRIELAKTVLDLGVVGPPSGEQPVYFLAAFYRPPDTSIETKDRLVQRIEADYKANEGLWLPVYVDVRSKDTTAIKVEETDMFFS